MNIGLDFYNYRNFVRISFSVFFSVIILNICFYFFKLVYVKEYIITMTTKNTF